MIGKMIRRLVLSSQANSLTYLDVEFFLYHGSNKELNWET